MTESLADESVPRMGSIVADFAEGLKAADLRRPVAVNARSGASFQPGIGPFSESGTVDLVLAEMAQQWPGRYSKAATQIGYPASPKFKCDLVICPGQSDGWSIEVKMLRILGDNGGINDNMVMHLLSPYPQHRSAVTDVQKLLVSGFQCRLGILIYGYAAAAWPLAVAIEAFERMAGLGVAECRRHESQLVDLDHPVHQQGQVFGWEIPAQPAMVVGDLPRAVSVDRMSSGLVDFEG